MISERTALIIAIIVALLTGRQLSKHGCPACTILPDMSKPAHVSSEPALPTKP